MLDVLQQTDSVVHVYPMTYDSDGFLCICTTLGQASDKMKIQPKYFRLLVPDDMVLAGQWRFSFQLCLITVANLIC